MDPISDMFIQIKNAGRVGHETVELRYSKFKHEIAKALERAGLIKGIDRKGKRVKKTLEIMLGKSDETHPLISDVQLLSKPSRRLYTPYARIQKSRRGGVVLLSTPKGVLSGDEARKGKVGGQLIAELW